MVTQDISNLLHDGDLLIWSAELQQFAPINISDILAISGTGGGSGDGSLSPHSHEGYWDGGWAGFNSGGK